MLTAAVGAVGAALAATFVRSARRAGTKARARRMRRVETVRLPAPIRGRLQCTLADAGLDLTPEAALGWWVLGGLAAVVLASALSPVIGVVTAFGAIAAGPVALANGRARTRRELDGAVPELLERTALELRSGGTVVGALTGGELPRPLQLDGIDRRLELGSSFSDALGSWADRLDRPDVRAAAGALGLAAAVGGRAADALDGLAASLRGRLAALADARAQAAQARLSALVVGAAPLAFLAFSAVTDGDTLRVLVDTSSGRACLVAGLALEALAIVWIRRIVGGRP